MPARVVASTDWLDEQSADPSRLMYGQEKVGGNIVATPTVIQALDGQLRSPVILLSRNDSGVRMDIGEATPEQARQSAYALLDAADEVERLMLGDGPDVVDALTTPRFGIWLDNLHRPWSPDEDGGWCRLELDGSKAWVPADPGPEHGPYRLVRPRGGVDA
ncbi:hypothetical protein [Mycobacteroides abscessus]|uniref:hypothetical protein n=1 Tax=Mycobacteroides abscessus TaxID=36809 RepID=UPI001041F5E4|nr:hypothetical protein [Mycobacteroides abscessus]